MKDHVRTIRHRIANMAERNAENGVTSIHHYLDKWWLAEAWRQLKPNKALGVDGVSKAQYGEGLSQRLDDLVDRIRSRRYWAAPVRRVDIPKGNGETRPLGLPSTEDKVLQKGFVMLVEPILEREFYDCSYGFRPGRNQHQALKALREHIGDRRLCWVLDLDIRKYFDSIPHDKLRGMFRRRIRDGVLNKLVVGWLKAGTLHEGQLIKSQEGTPQGGIVSPLLSNLYLHEAMDDWFRRELPSQLEGPARMVRYADDAVMCFGEEEDARRALELLRERLQAFGLELHPGKTRLVDMRPPIFQRSGGPKSIDFLGFTLHWGRTRKGNAVLKTKTAKDRFTRKVKELGEWLKAHRHEPLAEQHAQLSAKIEGHIQYYGVSFNSRSLGNLVEEVKRRWLRWLRRRGGRDYWTWERMSRYLKANPLPTPRIAHKLF